jgi:hypothetical protein
LQIAADPSGTSTSAAGFRSVRFVPDVIHFFAVDGLIQWFFPIQIPLNFAESFVVHPTGPDFLVSNNPL